MPITTIGIGAAVTPTVLKTAFSHYTNRKPRAKKPTAHLSYDQGLHLVRQFLLYASNHTVEEVQAFTGQWVPHPTWTRVENVTIPELSISKGADILRAQLGEEGIQAVGGSKWWLWRRKHAELQGEWIEMRSDYNARQKSQSKGRRVMLYVHGGGYFFGSVDEHRYQLQRHARKLKARVFAPRYRLAPQFPFPCGLLDCLAAYLYLLTTYDASEIVFAGDSAGGGMILSLLCMLRDQGVALPAGAVLISPWVDLTHSFPSLSREDDLDYIPAHGFMQKPSHSWPPPTEAELQELVKASSPQTTVATSDKDKPQPPQRVDTFEATHRARKLQPPLSLQLDGKEFLVREQIQLYTTNQLITHPFVSPALQPSLGGLPPLLIMVGGGELLRDEQIFVGHKAADPQAYKLSEHWRALYDPDETILRKYRPTPVQLQVWEDLCHVTPTLSFTRPAKFMYRAIAQFSAWALSRAQNRSIDIMVEYDSLEDSSSDDESNPKKGDLVNGKSSNAMHAEIGKAGDPLPEFRNNMIRQQVNRHGLVTTLPKAADLPALQMSADLIGMVKEGPIRNWLNAKQDWDTRFASTRRKIHKERLETIRKGENRTFGDGELPPPTALAGRLHDADQYSRTQKLKKSWGLGMWSSWGWKHDEKTLQQGEKLEKHEKRDEKKARRRSSAAQKERPDQLVAVDGTEKSPTHPRAASRVVTVQNEGQIEGEENGASAGYTPLSPALLISPPERSDSTQDGLTPSYVPNWKTATYLRDDSKDVSDAGSICDRTVPDNASTRAVFSAAGVSKDTDAVLSTPPGEPMIFDTHANGSAGFKDNLGEYDTPHSRRSVERLQDYQLDMNDGESIHTSIPTSLTDVKTNTNPQSQFLRNPSSMAIVQAEGVIDALEPTSETISSAKPDHANVAKSELREDVSQRGTWPEDREALESKTNVESKRPGLYDRDNSEFVTAKELL